MQPYFALSLLLAVGGGLMVESCETVASVVASSPQFSELAEALQLANLTGILDNEALQVTLFAPINAAFSETYLDLPAGSVVGDLGLLTAILLTHMVPESIKDLNDAQDEALPTLAANEELAIEGGMGGNISVLAANRVGVLDNKGILACQAMVYPVDGVLLPEQLGTLKPQATGIEELDRQLQAALMGGTPSSGVAGRRLLAAGQLLREV